MIWAFLTILKWVICFTVGILVGRWYAWRELRLALERAEEEIPAAAKPLYAEKEEGEDD